LFAAERELREPAHGALVERQEAVEHDLAAQESLHGLVGVRVALDEKLGQRDFSFRMGEPVRH